MALPASTVIGRPTSERSSRFASDSTGMSDDQNENEIRIPADEEEVSDMAGAETDEEKNLAVAQARLIGDL
jgi:hypothetical protein